MTDILAIGAHPDDVEIFMGGTLKLLTASGYTAAICDLTCGEQATYGTAEGRKSEAERAADLLGVKERIILDCRDGFLMDSREVRLKVIDIIRRFKPRIMFSFSMEDSRHPDHSEAGRIVRKCCFLAGLEKIKTQHSIHRPEKLFQFHEFTLVTKPDIVVDISETRDQKILAIETYGSQVQKRGEENGNSKTFVRSPDFWEVLDARDRQAGAMIGTRFGEPFHTPNPVGISRELRVF